MPANEDFFIRPGTGPCQDRFWADDYDFFIATVNRMKKTNLKNPILLLVMLVSLCTLPAFAQDKVMVSGTVFSAEDG